MEIKDLLLNKFKEDPLYKFLIKTGKTEDELFPLEILKLEENEFYSTFFTASLIKRNDDHVRYLLKRLINDKYVNDPYVGRNIRLDIYNVYRLFLANLISGREDKNYNDVRDVLGILKPVQKGKDKDYGFLATDLENQFANEKSSDSLLKDQVIKILNDDIKFMKMKSSAMQKKIANVYECLQAILEIDQQMLRTKCLIDELELEERNVYSEYLDLKHGIQRLNNEFKHDLDKVKWNRLLSEIISDRQILFRKQNGRFNVAISELIDTNVEKRLEKSKDEATKKASELVSLEIKLATIKQQIEEKRNELREQTKTKESILLENKKYFMFS